MKKQFFRVKQLADQTFLRADKSEGLNHEELQLADHKVELFRGALTAISKRIPAAVTQNSETAVEKRIKKYSEYQLGVVLHEQANRPDAAGCELFQYILKECAQVEQELAKEQVEHELKVEQMVSAPIQQVLENELPSIAKHKRNLSKYVLDKDSASNRYNAASKNGNLKDALKDDMEEADFKVEQSRDTLAAEMFNLLRRESEFSQYMLQLLKLERAYHESALKNLEKVIPKLEQTIGDSRVKAVFGVELEEHLRVTERRIAMPLEICVCALTGLGLSEEGLFRVVGGASRVKRLKSSIDSGCFRRPLLPEYRDVHVIASTLKLYLRELPEPLLTYSLYDEWMNAMRYPEDQRFRVIQEILKKLPQANMDNLTYLIQFLAKLSKNSENKMNASNIAIVIAPNLLWNASNEVNMHMNNCATVNMIVELFVNKVDLLFPDDLNFYLTMTRAELLDDAEFQRPNLNNVKLTNPDNQEANSYLDGYQPDNASPKPQMRARKTKQAPTPPSTTKSESDFDHYVSSYPSGSTTLDRSHKVKRNQETLIKTSVGVNTELIIPSRRQSVTSDALDVKNMQNCDDQAALVNIDTAKTADATYVLQPAANIQISKARPLEQITAQNVENIVKLNNQTKPVAAPRSINQEKPAFVRGDIMSKSLNAIDVDGEIVEIRRRDEGVERLQKPEVPVRPPSLKIMPKFAGDETLQKTQCSLSSVAHKQQPSIVNLQNRNSTERYQAGHDNQLTKKEKFLGHQPIDDKTSDINSNFTELLRNRTSSVGNSNKPIVPPKSVGQSNEKLNLDAGEKINGNSKSSHARTQSDGNIIDVSSDCLLHSPSSPRSLSKPTQPPPPPPINILKSKAEHDSTDL